MLSLEEAIQHCEEVAEKQEITAKSNLMEIDKIKADGVLRLYDADEYESCMECAEEHRQLAEWLKKLQAYEEAKERIIEVSWEHTFTFSDESEPMTYKICALDTVLEILGGKR